MFAPKNNLRPTATNHGSRSQAPRLPGSAPSCLCSRPGLPCSAAVVSSLSHSGTITTSTRNNNPALRLACQGTFGTSAPAATQPLPASLATVPIVLETTRPRETGTASTSGGGGGGGGKNNNSSRKCSAAIQPTFQIKNNSRGESLSTQEMVEGGGAAAAQHSCTQTYQKKRKKTPDVVRFYCRNYKEEESRRQKITMMAGKTGLIKIRTIILGIHVQRRLSVEFFAIACYLFLFFSFSYCLFISA